MVKKAVKQVKKRVPPVGKRTPGARATTAKKTAPARKAARTQEAGKPSALASLTHRLDTLLHTMRCIAQHEDELCTLLHDARRTGKVSGPLLRELQAVLNELPAEEYTDDLYAIRTIAGAA